MKAGRWIQHPITYKLIPRDEYVRPKDAGHAIFEDFKPFISPLDGSVISGRRAYDNHCRKHNVVNSAEFSPEHYERKAKERADFYTGRRSREESLQTKRTIYEAWNKAERGE